MAQRPSSTLSTALLAFGLSCCAETPRDTPPDVVLIVMDTTRQDRIAPFNDSLDGSPFFDRLAAGAVIYDNAWTASSWTAPSSATIHTGLHPKRHGVLECLWAQAAAGPKDGDIQEILAQVDLVAMPDSIQTLGEHLQSAGYRGIGVAANPNICKELGFSRGFESFTHENDTSCERLIAQFQKAKSEGDPTQPVFAFFHLNDPHAPYQRHESHCTHTNTGPESGAGPECTTQCWYQSEIEFVGAQLEQLFDEMDWWKSAIIVLVSDHGEEFGDHGQNGHKFTLRPELCRTPLMISAPGLPPSRALTPAHQVDILPTILGLLGLPQPAALDGMDLLAVTNPAERADRPILSHRSESLGAKGPKELWSLLIGDWRLTEELPAGTLELYDLASDPNEHRDLAALHTERVASMYEHLAQLKTSLTPLPRNQVQVDLTYRLNMELRRLGYAGSDDE